MKTLKPELLPRVSKWLNDFSFVLQDNTNIYTLFRARVRCNESGNICVDFLAGDINGNFKNPSFEYSQETEEFYYGSDSKFRFKDLSEVAVALKTLVGNFEAFEQPIDRVLFDMHDKKNLSAGYVKPALNTKSDVALYLSAVKDFVNDANFGLSDAVTTLNGEGIEELCGDWSAE